MSTTRSKSGSSSNKRKAQYKETLDALHEEMELFEPAMGKRGQRQRKMPKAQSKERTKKRRKLEKQDDWNALEGGEVTKKMRGAMHATEDRVIEGSLIFGAKNDEAEESFSDPDDQVDEESREEEEEKEEEQIEDSKPAAKPKSKTPPKSRTKGQPAVNLKKRRQMRRMKNFKSVRLAERHGDAIGAHAQGKPGLAIRKLKKVAARAPSAPQVYSSLGLVYESMLMDSQRKGALPGESSETSVNDNRKEPPRESRVSFSDDTKDTTGTTPHGNALAEQLILAKKAYGSYHVAAILCKRDYTLWSRAGEAACEVARLHSSSMELPDITREFREFHRVEKQRWLEEARLDYHTADHIHPPGIDIPARLAHVMIQLGMLSEALTLLSDLKDQPEFGISYRAWMLYADLMLRIGYECKKWNNGNRTNKNSMFRRWLRKLSTSFDWQERRTQALCKALEAGCGSKSCRGVMSWLKQRAAVDKTFVVANEEANEQDISEPAEEASELAREKELLRNLQETEVAAFDKTTRELKLKNGSVAARERSSTRAKLLKSQQKAMGQLGEGDIHLPSAQKDAKECTVDKEEDLALSASFGTVFVIASELMRHLLDMELYKGGKLVGEAVSQYMKERASLWQSKKQARAQRASDPVELDLESILPLAQAVPIQVQSDSEEDSDVPLSDEEEFEKSPGSSLFASLMRGTLPPGIRILYGISLAFSGENVHLASACIRSLNELPKVPVSWLSETELDTSIAPDEDWLLLREHTNAPLSNTTALAFVADGIIRSEKRDLVSLSGLFRTHVHDLEDRGFIATVLAKRNRTDSTSRFRHDQIVKILLADTLCSVTKAELSVDPDSNQGLEQCGEIILEALDSINELVPVVWTVESNGSISSTNKRVVASLAISFRLACRLLSRAQLEKSLCNEFSRKAAGKMLKAVAILCNSPELSIDDDSSRSIENIVSIPISSSWLSPDLELVSRRMFNLCVANNVSLFSGWELQEFSVKLLRSGTHNFFGVVMDDGQVAGYVPFEVENEIAEQWEIIERHVKGLSLDFRGKLTALRETQWYKKIRARYQEQRYGIASYQEDSGLEALLCFSRCCLALPEGKGLYVALSTLLPISQFCLNQTLWEARIGQHRTPGTATRIVEPDKLVLLGSGNDAPTPPRPSSRPGYIKPAKRLALKSKMEKPGENIPLHETFSFEAGCLDDSRDFLLRNLSSISLDKLQEVWQTSPSLNQSGSREVPDCKEDMKTLDSSMHKLRACYTTQAIEKSSLQVSSSLLKLAISRISVNPLVCIQQAAVFASQATKGGISDQVFRAPIPRPNDCTAEAGLVIVGRADCLQAVHFLHEAAFLCNYVASVCSRHRDPSNKDSVWNDRWKIVSILNYDLSVRIRSAIRLKIEDQDWKKDDAEKWDSESVFEFRSARKDSLQLKTGKDVVELAVEKVSCRSGKRVAVTALHETDPLHAPTIGEHSSKEPEMHSNNGSEDNDDESTNGLEIVAV